MTRIYDEWQIQAKAEMMRRGWEAAELREFLNENGHEVSTEVVRKALNSNKPYTGTAVKICEVLNINDKLKEEERPSYVKPRKKVF